MRSRILLFSAAVLITLTFVRSRASALDAATAPNGKPEASIDLATDAGATLVKGQWRYSDTRILIKGAEA
ncbi:MAG TPA: hypothetical protein VKM94_13160 [Blastocatellia bacterium]|nr:hypothetical protein [Blastocatellia bacterium]